MKKFLLSTITIIAGTVSLSAQIPTSGLMAKWSFDGDLTADSHGSYTLTNNGATLSDGFQSAPNTAALFNGTAIMGSTNTAFQRNTFSMSTWVYTTQSNFFHTLANVRINVSSSPFNSFNLCVGSYTGNKLTFFFTTSSGNDLSLQDTTEQVIHDSTWTHVAVSCNFDGTNTAVKLFVNGAMHAQGSFLGDIQYPVNNPFTLGNVNGATDANNALFGKLNEFLFYDRALTPSEVSTIYGTVSTNISNIKNDLLEISVYPNPTTSVLNIEVKEQTQITIVNVLGEIVKTETINGLSSLDVTELSSGVYFIQSNTGIKSKFIKQ
jgi:hypothetical protein